MTNLYRPISEREEDGKYSDIRLEKDFRVQGDLNEWLLELKYVKTGGSGSSSSNLEKKVAEAIREGMAQLEKYTSSRGLAGKGKGKTKFKQVVMVLIGRDEVRWEERIT